MRYLSQRFAMPYKNVCGVLTDIGTEELAHLEMICTIVHQLTRDLTPEQVKKSGFWSLLCRPYSRCMATSSKWCTVLVQRRFSLWEIQLQILSEDLAAEQKARTTYDNLLRLIDDPDVREPLKFLRGREIVHFPEILVKHLGMYRIIWILRIFYAINPAFDHSGNCSK